MTKTERLRPSDGEQEGRSLGQERLLLGIIDLPDQLDVLAVEARLKPVFEVKALGARYLGSDTQGFFRPRARSGWRLPDPSPP
jgi:hypothetical protein